MGGQGYTGLDRGEPPSLYLTWQALPQGARGQQARHPCAAVRPLLIEPVPDSPSHSSQNRRRAWSGSAFDIALRPYAARHAVCWWLRLA